MRNKGMRWLALSASAITLMAALTGCPGQVEISTDSGATSTGASAPGSGGSGATAGSGGTAAAGGIGGEGGDPFPCGIDCTSITVGECKIAQCNMTTLNCEIVNGPDGDGCDDGQFCTVNDQCLSGECFGGPPNDCGFVPAQCDGVICDEVNDTCSLAPLANGTPCDDSTNLCVVAETCQNGLCVGTLNTCAGQPVPSDCQVAVCDPSNGMCVPVPGNDGAPCIDQTNLCTTNQTCSGGVCGGGTPLDCSILTQGCDLGVCDPSTGMCQLQPAMNGQVCNDLSACTTGEICTNGVCGGGAPVTVCEQMGDGCCPTNCNATNDIDCTVLPSCLAIKTSVPASTSGVYVVDPDLSGPIPQTSVFCDMDQDNGGWTLIARFANQDAANWMLDSGEWWYTHTQEVGQTTSRADNADMLSRAFWTVPGTEIRLSRTDNANDAALFRTNAGCIPNTHFRGFIISFGNFQNGAVWGSDSVAGTCPGIFGNNYASTNGFQYATCASNIGAPNSISFWADWSAGDGAVIMIGGGGTGCSRADHGIGVTEANAASFSFIASAEDDFGSNGSDSLSNDPYALNLWIR